MNGEIILALAINQASLFEHLYYSIRFFQKNGETLKREKLEKVVELSKVKLFKQFSLIFLSISYKLFCFLSIITFKKCKKQHSF